MARLRRYLRWAVRIVGGIACLVIVVLVAGATYQAVAGNPDERRYPSPGRLIDIGGRRLHLYCVGHGSPTVVLEAGLGWGMVAWRRVQPILAQTTQVCSYDRAGYGWSDAGPLPRSSSQISSDLHSLLQKARVPVPCVLAGHSLGGLYIRHYAATYPAEVSGMVLVDSSHEDQDYPGRLLVMVGRTLQAAGLRRLIFRFGDPALNAMYSSNKTNMAATEEMAAIPRSADELRATHFSLGSKPLVVVTAGQNDSDEMWHRLQVDLLGRSSNSHRVVAEGSGRRVQDDRPDVVIAAIREVVGTSVHP